MVTHNSDPSIADAQPGFSPKERPLLTDVQVATALSVSIATVRRWRLLRQGPPHFKLGALVRYRVEDLQLWLNQRPTGGDFSVGVPDEPHPVNDCFVPGPVPGESGGGAMSGFRLKPPPPVGGKSAKAEHIRVPVVMKRVPVDERGPDYIGHVCPQNIIIEILFDPSRRPNVYAWWWQIPCHWCGEIHELRLGTRLGQDTREQLTRYPLLPPCRGGVPLIPECLPPESLVGVLLYDADPENTERILREDLELAAKEGTCQTQ